VNRTVLEYVPIERGSWPQTQEMEHPPNGPAIGGSEPHDLTFMNAQAEASTAPDSGGFDASLLLAGSRAAAPDAELRSCLRTT
jgi:hypothetical protein